MISTEIAIFVRFFAFYFFGCFCVTEEHFMDFPMFED